MLQPPTVRFCSAAFCVLTVLAPAARAGAEPAPQPAAPPVTDAAAVPGPVAAACDPATTERLDFLTARLDERRTYARRWWMGFTGFYALGTVVSSVQASQEGNSGQRANYVVSAVKSVFGTGRLWFDRPAAVRGAEPVREALPNCDQALEHGEELLRRAARETGSRSSWKRHLSIVGINVAGALIGGEGWGARKDAWISAATGIGVGEVMAWSHPWHGIDDLAEYEARFPERSAAARPRVAWQLLPTANGLALHLSF